MRSILQKFYFLVLVLLLSIVTYQCTTTYASNYYIDKNADGNNNGTSWEDAWQSFAEIKWNRIQPGDTIFISGGTDSLIYYEELSVGASGTAANPIIIIAGKYSPSSGKHSGRVIIDGGLTRNQSIYVQKDYYVTIKGFECRHATKGVHVEDYASNIILDSLNIYDYQDQAGIFINASTEYTIDSTTIRNCRIMSYQMYAGQTDGIYVQRAQRTVIHNNYVRIPNQDPVAHNDALQAHLANGFTIYDNIFINDSVYSQEGGGIPIILGSQGNNPVIIYNNFIYMGGIWWPSGNIGAALCTRWYDVSPMPPTWIIHNTIVVNGPRCRGVWQQYPATMINNIIAMFSTAEGMESFNVYDLPSAAIVDSIRKNLFWCSWADPGFSGQFTGNDNTGIVTGWTDWVNTYGGTDVKEDPLFINNIGYEQDQGALNGKLHPNSPTINKGENVKALIESFGLPWTDINGNPRDDIPTIGSYEYKK
jgi:hypothetical protein